MKNLAATFCLTIAVLLGNAGVSWSADFQTGVAAYERRDYETALREWTPLAERGDVEAQGSLGEMYRQENGVRQDYKTAAWWFRRAAEQGNTNAQVKLGELYSDGKGIPKDNVSAYMWWSVAASSLNRDAIKSRDRIAGKLSKAELEQAQDLARECARSAYKGC